MSAYYNEIDAYAAQWLRNLIAAGLIAPGDVDERDIRDVGPDELRGYTQCHFFAGIGVWSLALRNAGWPDDRQVWTGSCPCQPFSAAGRRAGTADERHLWPRWFHLIGECRPSAVFGEQVASKDGLGWFDLVSADLEGSAYAVGASDLCAAGVGAPHIRQRLWFCAYDLRPAASGLQHASGDGRQQRWSEPGGWGSTGGCGIGQLADTDDEGLEGWIEPGRERAAERASGAGVVVERLADADGRHASAERQQRGGEQRQHSEDGGAVERVVHARGGRERGNARSCAEGDRQATCRRDLGADGSVPSCNRHSSPTNGFWRDADWLFCRDGKWRPVEPGTFPLVDGSAFNVGSGSTFQGKSRQGMLRGYGNAIVERVARTFIEARLDLDSVDAGSLDDILG
jgi:DNA (cytosine-5)-methyltransferase 1